MSLMLTVMPATVIHATVPIRRPVIVLMYLNCMFYQSSSEYIMHSDELSNYVLHISIFSPVFALQQ